MKLLYRGCSKEGAKKCGKEKKNLRMKPFHKTLINESIA